MKSSRTFATMIFALSIALMVGPHQSCAQSLEELRTKYEWGAIYVTSSSLIDIFAIESSGSFPVDQRGSGLSVIVGFIRRVGQNRINKNLSFLHLDLRTLRAGFATPNSNFGVLTPLAWSEIQVVSAAQWLDRFFTSSHAAEVAMVAMRNLSSDGASVEALVDAYTTASNASEDPFLPPRLAFALASSFRALLANSTQAMVQIHESNPDMYRQIGLFENRYDRRHFSLERANPGPGPFVSGESPVVFGELPEGLNRAGSEIVTDSGVRIEELRAMFPKGRL